MIGNVQIVGLCVNSITFLASSLTKGTDEGKPASISDNNTAAVAGDGDLIHGQIFTVDPSGELAVLHTKGYVQFTYSGTAPTAGAHQAFVGDGADGIKLKDTPAVGDKHFDVVSVDTDDSLVVIDLG